MLARATTPMSVPNGLIPLEGSDHASENLAVYGDRGELRHLPDPGMDRLRVPLLAGCGVIPSDAALHRLGVAMADVGHCPAGHAP
ncbi:hypothetical protein D3C85_1307300 [compost metagenome]